MQDDRVREIKKIDAAFRAGDAGRGRTEVTTEWQQALRAGDLDTLNRLLMAGADINAADRHGQTSLMMAAREGQTAVVKFLLDGRAELNHTAKYQLSALMLAVLAGHLEVVQEIKRPTASSNAGPGDSAV